jgi:hypothetical protein
LFDIPEELAKELVKSKKEGSAYKIIDGVINGRSPSVWFTNIDHKKRHEKLILYKTYNKDEFPKYDNYDAINVDKTNEIPVDYMDAMGVPISFLDKYNPDQFEIIGQGRSDLCAGMKNMSAKFVNDYYKSGGTGSYKEGNPLLGYYDKTNKAVIPYMRIIIKRKKLNGN